MPFPITIIFQRNTYKLSASLLSKNTEYIRYQVSGTSKSMIIKKKVSIPNLPWELEQGSFGALRMADLMDFVRAVGAAIERGY